MEFWNWNSILVSNTPVAVTGLNCIVATACAWRWCWCFSRCWCCACSGCCRSRSRICWTWAWHFDALAWIQEVVWSPIQALEFWNRNPVLVSNTPVTVACLDSIRTACCWGCSRCTCWSRRTVWWSSGIWRWPWTWHLEALTWVKVVVGCAVQTLEFWDRNPVLVGNTPVAVTGLDGVWTACCWGCTCCASWSRRAIWWSWCIGSWTWHFNALAWVEGVIRCTIQALEFLDRNPVLISDTPVAIACLDCVWTARCWCCRARTCSWAWSWRSRATCSWSRTWYYQTLTWIEEVARRTIQALQFFNRNAVLVSNTPVAIACLNCIRTATSCWGLRACWASCARTTCIILSQTIGLD